MVSYTAAGDVQYGDLDQAEREQEAAMARTLRDRYGFGQGKLRPFGGSGAIRAAALKARSFGSRWVDGWHVRICLA